MDILYCLTGNEPLLLDDRQNIWIIKTGTIALFAAKVKDSLVSGDRQYLFDVGAGEALFGAALGEEWGLLAVAIEPTKLYQINTADLVAQVTVGEERAIGLVNGWVNRLKKTLSQEYTAAFASQNLSFINSESAASLPNILADLHTDLFNYVNGQELQKTEATFRQLQEREELNLMVVSSALSKLAGVVKPQQETVFFQQGIPLLIAAGAVGKAMGITISPPAQLEELKSVKDSVEAIARSSQFRIRIVLLEDGWWRREYGPVLAYTIAGHPVALLVVGNGYVLFDGVTQTRTRVNETVAATLALEAYQFYRPLPSVINNLLSLLKFGFKGYGKDIASILVVGIIGTLLGMVVPQATGILIDNAIPDGDRNLLWQLALALLALGLGRSAFEMSQGIIALRVENSVDSSLQMAVWDKLLGLSPAFFREYASGDLLNRTLSVNQIRKILSGGTLRTLMSGVFGLLNLVLMFVYSWRLALVGVGIALLTTAVTFVVDFLVIRNLRRLQELDGEISGLVVQLINGVAKLRLAQAEDRAFAAWAQKYGDRMNLEAGLQRLQDRMDVFNESLSLVSSAVLYWFGVQSIQMAQANDGSGLTIGTFLAFNVAFGIFSGAVSSISTTVTDILGIVPLWERAKPILQTKPEYEPHRVNPGQLQSGVVLERVTFRYRDEGLPVLNDITLCAQPGEFVAIVGPSGSGKSTIVRLLLGFETPNSGRVYYDGKDLASLDLVAVRRQLGVVLQSGRIGSGSIFENITAGALVSHDRAWEAARMAGFAEDIEQMPMKMHTVISEGGTNLSGGQKQRLLIARALVNQPKIIVMDEATSSLDNRTQGIVVESLDKLKATRIVIAHRLSTIRHADRIYVVEAGRVVQVGTFEELVQQEGLFAQLVARQME